MKASFDITWETNVLARLKEIGEAETEEAATDAIDGLLDYVAALQHRAYVKGRTYVVKSELDGPSLSVPLSVGDSQLTSDFVETLSFEESNREPSSLKGALLHTLSDALLAVVIYVAILLAAFGLCLIFGGK